MLYQVKFDPKSTKRPRKIIGSTTLKSNLDPKLSPKQKSFGISLNFTCRFQSTGRCTRNRDQGGFSKLQK